MHRRLRYQSIWQGYVDYAGDEACTSEQEKVPVKAAGFLEGKLFGLGGYAALIL